MACYSLKENMDSDKLAFDIFNSLKNEKLPIFLCVGNSKCVGDCLGPLVGERLIKKYDIPAFVYGNLDFNICLNNLDDYVSFIRKTHPDNPIILIDSSIGSEEDFGTIKFNKGGVIPGGAFGERTQLLGDYGLTSIVNVFGISKLLFLRGTTIKVVMKLSSFIAEAIYKFIKKRTFSKI